MKVSTAAALFVSGLVLVSSSCKKSHVAPKPDALAELNFLAPATQTGQNLIGCLVGGNILETGNGLFKKNIYDSYYVWYNAGSSFYVSGLRDTAPFVAASITVETDSLQLKEKQTILLINPGRRKAWGSYDIEQPGAYNPAEHYRSVANKPGKLYITHLDSIGRIFSGTFSFDAVNGLGDTAHITNGRFDVHVQ